MKAKNLKLGVTASVIVCSTWMNAQDEDWSPYVQSQSCINTASPWVLGGNMIVPPPTWNQNYTCLTCPHPLTDVGTCNDFSFILKANNAPAVFITPGSRIGLGLNNSAPKAVLDVCKVDPVNDPNLVDMSHFLVYGDGAGHLESTTDVNLHFVSGGEFKINEGTVNNATNHFLIRGGRVGVGTWGMPDAKFEVYQSDMLQSNSGDNNILISRLSGNCNGSNTFKQSQWLVRTGTATNWESVSIHDGISIDNAFLTPRSNVTGISASAGTKTWWERNPYDDSQSWGNNGTKYMSLDQGKLHIGTKTQNQNPTHAGALLTVYGKIVSNEVIVTQQNWSDFVFDNQYKLMPLKDLEAFYTYNHHLPGVPSTKDVVENGNDIGKTDAILLQKIEELTLYIVQQQKEIESLKEQIKK